MMWRNYLKIALRHLRRSKTSSIIHLLGLSLGISSALLIYLFVYHERSYDAYHEHKDDIYRVVNITQKGDGIDYDGNLPYPVTGAMRNDFPELEAVVGLHYEPNVLVAVDGDQLFQEKHVFFAEPTFPDVFTVTPVAGDVRSALSQPNQVVLTETLAKKYFGARDPIGQSIKLKNQLDLSVGAVIADVPENTHLPLDMLVSFESFSREFLGFPIDGWAYTVSGSTYVRLPKGMSQEQFEKKLSAFVEKYYPASEAVNERLALQPVQRIHFDTRYAASNIGDTIEPYYLRMFEGIGIFILLLACINFINLSTAQSTRRAMEVGVRKVLGAGRRQLIAQFWGEAFLLVLVAGIVSVVLAKFLLPTVNRTFDLALALSELPLANMVAFFAVTLLLTGVLAGLYPALVQSRFLAVDALKSNTKSGTGGNYALRSSLVVFQFIIGIVLLVGTLVVSSQMNYFYHKSLGYNKEAIISVNLPKVSERLRLYNELINLPEVQEVSFANGAPVTENNIGITLMHDGKELLENNNQLNVYCVDANYEEVFGLALIAGRWLTNEDTLLTTSAIPFEDRQYRFVVNETFTRHYGYAEANDILGKKIQIAINDMQGEVIGVVKDFHTSSLHDEIVPTAMLNLPFFYAEADIKLNPNTLATAIPKVEAAWENVFPNQLANVQFFDDTLGRLYEKEARFYALFKFFVAVAIAICCLGLWGLVTYLAEQKRKEIGIRKVLGASVGSILVLLSRDFVKLVLIAMLIAVPIAWWGMNTWLADFAYRIDMQWWMFALAGIGALTIALLTVSFQAVRAAVANPVESLKNE